MKGLTYALAIFILGITIGIGVSPLILNISLLTDKMISRLGWSTGSGIMLTIILVIISSCIDFTKKEK